MPERNRLRAALKKTGIETGIHHPLPLHQQPAYSRSGHAPEDFLVISALSKRILSLPSFPGISQTEIERAVDPPPEALELIHPEVSVTLG